MNKRLRKAGMVCAVWGLIMTPTVSQAGSIPQIYELKGPTCPTSPGKAPVPENLVIKTSAVDVDSEDYKAILNVIDSHTSWVYGANVYSGSSDIVSRDLKTRIQNLDYIPIMRDQIRQLKAFTIRKDEANAGIRKLQENIEAIERECSPQKQAILRSEIADYDAKATESWDTQKGYYNRKTPGSAGETVEV